MQKAKHNAYMVVIIAILFVTGLSFASAFRAQSNPFVSAVSADDEDGGDDEGDDEEDDEDEDEKEDESDNDRDENEGEEDEDGDEEDERGTRTKITSSQTRNQEVDDDEDEDENKDADELKEEIGELNDDIAKVEARIGILAASGMSVDAFRNSLSEIRGLLAGVWSNSQNAEKILETAEHKLERLEKLVKISLKDDDEDEESMEEAAEEIAELKRDILKIETRLNTASAGGINVSAYQIILNDAKTMLSQAETKLSAGLYVEAEALAELADKKLDRIDDDFEDYEEDEDDEDDVSDEYKSEVALFVHNLKTIGEIEGGIGQEVSVVAQAQNDSRSNVEAAIFDVGDRGEFMKFLIGPKYGSIEEIKKAIEENQNRINVLTEITNKTTDSVVKQVLQDQINILIQQNNNLQKFVAQSQEGVSLFGWLLKLFS